MTDEEREIAKVTGFIKLTSTSGPEEVRWIRMSAITSVVSNNFGFVVTGGQTLTPFTCRENPLELIAEAQV